MTELKLRQAIHETLEGIKKLRVASQTHPVEAMRELCREADATGRRGNAASMRELDAGALKPVRDT